MNISTLFMSPKWDLRNMFEYCISPNWDSCNILSIAMPPVGLTKYFEDCLSPKYLCNNQPYKGPKSGTDFAIMYQSVIFLYMSFLISHLYQTTREAAKGSSFTERSMT